MRDVFFEKIDKDTASKGLLLPSHIAEVGTSTHHRRSLGLAIGKRGGSAVLEKVLVHHPSSCHLCNG